MRLLRAFAIALITALVGMFLAIFAGDYLTRLIASPILKANAVMPLFFLVRRSELLPALLLDWWSRCVAGGQDS
jgi:hypothetical protein